ncbi:aldehyde dehydrogenase family protein [Reticulomyxa filosa]|uniref:Aldehyde dehydrogenase family protein n=1 Tax=Reticulomyxa filosa TaxID=46433 RepID=X6M8J9_RETFI|nr:aldehyde dehydrogenase family protein [Reticulomyxa filosa]|eukprot:ETO09797.1 aldehyde dehydrogenase family protein [Reticulomyxa filosa]
MYSFKSVSRVCSVSISASRHFSSHKGKLRNVITVDNPYTGAVHCEVPQSSLEDSVKLLSLCDKAQKEYWGETRSSVMSRQSTVVDYIQSLKGMETDFVKEITESMGKPLHQAINEFNTMIERAEALLDMSSVALDDEQLSSEPNMKRILRKEALGTVLIIAPWNYPLLCSINSIIPAILAGNSILFKMSSRTPIISELFAKATQDLDLPKHFITPIHCDHDVTSAVEYSRIFKKFLALLYIYIYLYLIKDPKVGFVVFTGSVAGGKQIQSAVSTRFINCTLELGGKDPAYVCDDSDIEKSAFTIVDGAVYNAGQSCCAVERCYVHEKVAKKFLECCVENFKLLKLGDPNDESTTVGPMATPSAPQFLQSQVRIYKYKYKYIHICVYMSICDQLHW